MINKELLKLCREKSKNLKLASKTKEYLNLLEKFSEVSIESPSLNLLIEVFGNLLFYYLTLVKKEKKKTLSEKLFKSSDKRKIRKKLDLLFEISLKDRYPVGLTKRDFPTSREENVPEEASEDYPEESFGRRETSSVSPLEREKVKEPFMLSVRTELAKNLPGTVMANISRVKKILSFLDQVLPYADKKEFQILMSLKFKLDQVFDELTETAKKLLSSNFFDFEAIRKIEELTTDLKVLEEIFEEK